MAVRWEHLDITQSERIQRTAGFKGTEVAINTHGGATGDDGTFVPGGVVVVVTADALRAREAERIIS